MSWNPKEWLDYARIGYGIFVEVAKLVREGLDVAEVMSKPLAAFISAPTSLRLARLLARAEARRRLGGTHVGPLGD